MPRPVRPPPTAVAAAALRLLLLAPLAAAPGCPDDPPADDDDSTAAPPADADGDGFAADEDCDDGDPSTYPGAEELCDGIDNDCDGLVDDDLADTDEDGFADCVDPTPDGFEAGDGRPPPRSVQLHLHGSLSEHDGTMAWGTAEAEALGIDALWWSDHDNMIQMATRGGGYDFDAGAFVDTIERVGLTSEHGIYERDDDLATTDSTLVPGGPSGAGWYWQLVGTAPTADADWHEASFEYAGGASGAYQRMPLLADVTATVQLRLAQPPGPDWRLRIDAELGGNLDGGHNRISYVLATADVEAWTTDDHLHVPLSVPWELVWTEVELPLSADAAHFALGDEQSLQSLSFALQLRDGAQARVDVDELVFTWQREGEALRDYQREVLDERHGGGPVVHHVGQEITLVEERQHVNVIAADPVPLYPYSDGLLTIAEAVQHAQTGGALAQCNHPFGVANAVLYEDADADLQVELLAESWLAADAYGCDLLEVGYRERGVDLEHLLMFWDRLTAAGHRLVGVGTNDQHWSSAWIDFVNPFHSWVFVDEPGRAEIAGELARGRAFFGDPAPFVGEQALLELWCEHGAVMGDELVTALDLPLRIDLGHVEPGWTLRLVVDGVPYLDEVLVGDEVGFAARLARDEVARTVRAELADLDGERVLLSNPIYLAWPDAPAGGER